MKYFLTFLLIAFLSGCSLSAGNTAKKIGAGVTKCCSSLALTKVCTGEQTPQTEVAASIIPASILERSGQILTW